MLHQSSLEQLALDIGIAPLIIVREWWEIEVLAALAASPLADRIVFYGGTALRLAYGSVRFSEDLDFLYRAYEPGDVHILERVLQGLTQKEEGIALEEVKDKRNTLFGLLRIQYPAMKHAIHLKIEISKRPGIVAFENQLITSPVTSREVIMPVATPAALFGLKQDAIKDRTLARDWYDYWYLCQRYGFEKGGLPGLPLSVREFRRELQRWLPKKEWGRIDMALAFFDL